MIEFNPTDLTPIRVVQRKHPDLKQRKEDGLLPPETPEIRPWHAKANEHAWSPDKVNRNYLPFPPPELRPRLHTQASATCAKRAGALDI